ncbi:MAG TPA: hydroxyphenylacetyl-CoA thioesterase PaaI [Hyphomicrobiaceae bacterium]|nr:hydroxyphenylacetyl-CoA thioesterase PaaI [Hyphomicrobiaceae bacterium]
MTRDAAEMAQACADAMWADDKASRAMGMRIEKVGPGFALLSMSVGVDMVNGHGLCHGGYIFSLADSTLAFACNSHNQRHVAQHCQIAYLSPARLGMRLLAEARERFRGERSGIYDVTVRTEAGETIAEFRGHSRSIPGALVSEA